LPTSALQAVLRKQPLESATTLPMTTGTSAARVKKEPREK
jgi:hypothetical protein